jgi:uncharacterized protein (TIGR00255 family)
MKSMTGYGSGSASTGDAEISVIVKSVNGRFLEPRFHLPKEYFSFEASLKKELSQIFRRGTVDVFVHRRSSTNVNIQLNKALSIKWLRAFKDLSAVSRVRPSADVVFDRLAALPQIFEIKDKNEIKSKEKIAFQKAYRKALAVCSTERTREGASLAKQLSRILNKLFDCVRSIEKCRGEANKELEVKLRERMRRLGLEGAVEPTRMAQEMIIYLDKSDISEEIERLKEHVRMCEKLLKSHEEKGKKLDFYTQELLREVNTIGSKANFAALTEQVVEAKSLIEAFKEQVQNIE